MNNFIILTRKMLRENALWAAIMSLLLLGSLVYSLNNFRYTNIGNVFGASFNLITSLGFPLVAGALGLLLTLFEVRGDKWAFLIHRPVSPAFLLYAKLFAGLLLYSLAVLIPLFLVLIWVAQPGHLRMPFLWSMSLPALANVLVAASCLPVAMAIGLRHKTSYFVRALPLGLPIFASFLAANAFEFHHALIIAGASFLIGFFIARHAFLANLASSPHAHPIPRSLGQAATILSILISFACITLLTFWIAAYLFGGQTDFTWSNYMLDKHSRVLLATSRNKASTFTHPDGSPVSGNPTYQSLRPPEITHLHSHLENFRYPMGAQAPYTSPSRYIFQLNSQSSIPSQRDWFLDFATGRIQGISAEKNLRAYFGPQGFDTPDAPPRPGFDTTPIAFFPINHNSAISRLTVPSAVYLLDIGRLTLLKTIITARPGETILAAGDGFSNAAGDPSPQHLILTNQRLIFLDAQTNDIQSELPLSNIPANQPFDYVRLARIGNTLNILFNADSDAPTNNLLFLSIDQSSQKFLKIQILPPPPGPLYRVPPVYDNCAGLLIGPVPITLLSSTVSQKDPFKRTLLSPIEAPSFPWLLASATLGLAGCLFFAMRRRLAVFPLLAWAALGTFFGLPAVLAIAFAAPRIALQRCPACARSHPVTQSFCPGCHAASAPPPRSGAEILTPLA